MKLTENKIFRWLKNNLVFVFSFIVPVLVMILVYYLRKIYPFGTEMYLRSDMYHQYAPFHQELQRKLTSGGSLFYSWNIGMGTNFISLMSYYLASPLNFLMAFMPQNHMPEIMSFFIILKIGLCGLTFSYYLGKHFQTRSATLIGFGGFYALSSYVAAYSWNLMWLDCLVLLPLITYGIERLVKYRKCMLYCITLSLAIFSNYYIAIMLCIYSVLYFLIQLVAHFKEFKFLQILKVCFLFGLFSLLAGAFAAIYLFPEYHTLMLSASGDMDFPKTLSQYFSVLHMLARGLAMVEPAVLNSPHDPNLYSSVIVFILVPLYMMCKKVDFREKVGKVLLLGLLLISFNLNIPNFIWHGFHFPNSLPCRESFIFIFLALAMSYEALHHIDSFERKQLMGTLAGVLVFFMIIEEFMLTDEYKFTIVYISGAFILLYTLLLEVMRHKKYQHFILSGILMLVCVCEAALNTEETAVGTTSREAYTSDNKSITKLLNNIPKTDDFYRVAKEYRRTKNDSAWSNYHGVSLFSSNTNVGVNEFLNLLGHETSYNSYSYFGRTPFSSSLLSVRYLLSNVALSTTSTMEFSDSTGDYYLYENLYTLPLSFWIPSTTEENAFVEGNNPFAIQNSLLYEMTGYDNMFTTLQVEDGKSVTVYSKKHTSDAYIFIATSISSATIQIYSAENQMISTKDFTDLSKKMTLHVGTVPKGGYFRVIPTGEGASSLPNLQLYAYAFHVDVFRNGVETLKQQALEIKNYTDTTITGTASIKEDGQMYTSIPYEKGWHVYVDGKEVETYDFQGAFLSYDIGAGDHKIEMEFIPEGFIIGRTITICSVIGMIICGFVIPISWQFYRKKRAKSHLKSHLVSTDNNVKEPPKSDEKKPAIKNSDV